MTDERACEQRDQIEALAAKVDELLELQRGHIAEYHGELTKEGRDLLIEEHNEIVPMVKANNADIADRGPKIDLLVELIAGKLVRDPFTGLETGVREAGIAERVETLEHRANGGGGISMRTRDKLVLIVANGVIAVIVSALAVFAALVKGL